MIQMKLVDNYSRIIIILPIHSRNINIALFVFLTEYLRKKDKHEIYIKIRLIPNPDTDPLLTNIILSSLFSGGVVQASYALNGYGIEFQVPVVAEVGGL